MANKAYKQSILREIISSKARFISIIVIILLGVSFYAGIKSSGPDMNAAINQLYQTYHLMDSKVVSTLGLTQKDLELLQTDERILDTVGSHTIDVNLTSSNNLVRFMGYDPKSTINKYVLLEGRLPENSGEIALDERAFKMNPDLKLGAHYQVASDEEVMTNFKETEFEIVGIVRNPMYIEKEARGFTPVGKGTIDYFAVVNDKDLAMSVYTELYVRFKNVQGLEAYSETYSELMAENTVYLEDLFAKRVGTRIEEVKGDVQKELDQGYEELNANEQKLLDAEQEVRSGRTAYEEGKQQYDEGRIAFEKGIKAGENKLSEGTKALEAGQNELAKQEASLKSGEKALEQAKIQLDQTRQTFTQQGIDPDASTETIDGQIQALQALVSQGQLDADDPQLMQLMTLREGITSYQQGKATYEAQRGAMDEGKRQIDRAKTKLARSKVQLAEGRQKLEYNRIQGQKELDQVQKQLKDSEQQLRDGEKEIQINKQKLADGKAEIAQQQKEAFEQLEKSSYYIFDRTDNQGYLGYKDAIVSLDNIASVLPLFFFLVAIMICLTTMTRMVEENRIEIGTLKALGYTNLEISWKYIIYATLASVLGSVLGIVIGSNILPSVISSAYGSLYSQPALTIYYYPAYVIQSMLLSIVCTVGAALFVIRQELKNKPSQLMQAKAPKIGKKILLERITPLWSRLSFNHKVTLRNIFRYKQRMLMTILGISGCMALLVTGFGLKDSTSKIVDQQFDKLWRYEAMVILDENATEEANADYEATVSMMPGYESGISMHQQSVTFEKEKMNKQTATLYVPQPGTDLDAFVSLNDRLTGEKYEISDEGVIINEKLAKLLGVAVNDTMTLKDEQHNSYTVRVAHIAENYVMHFLYMSPAYYQEVFAEQPSYNTQFLNFDDNAEADDVLASKLLTCDSVINVTMKAQMEKSTEETNDSMKLVMVVIIVSAGALAFVVLYNLNNINVSERIRELSTIKVLGFYHNEVTMYILRENVILTLLGILAGSFLGKILHGFILQTAETDIIMLYPEISMTSYIFSALLTLLFSFVVMILMHIKIKNVNMIDALKSNE